MNAPLRPDFSTFVEVAQLLNSSLELHVVLRQLLEGLHRLLGPSDWSLLLVDQSGELVFTLARSEVHRELMGRRLKPGEGIAGWVAARGETLLIRDVRTDPRFSRRMDEATSFVTHSILAVPLRIGSRVVGVIEIVNALDEREFTSEDVVILEAFANFAAVAIENARANGALVEANRNDPLTGLRNSSYFLSSVEEAVRQGERFSLIFFDMDNFKPLVDQHGHMRGSAALVEVGWLMAETLRAGEIGCRFGGDEVAMLLAGVGGDAAAVRALDFAELLATHTFLEADGINAKLEASFGWAAFPNDAVDATELLRLADARMFATKRRRAQARTA